VPTLGAEAISFLKRAKEGIALTRSRKRYADGTLGGYEVMLRRHVLPHVDPRSGQSLAELQLDELDGRRLQSLVDALAATNSAAVARAAYAAVAAVLRDAYGRGVIDVVPPRLALPPPPKGRDRTVTVVEADRLLEAAEADDQRLRRSLMAPLVALLTATGGRITEALSPVWGPGGLDLDADPPVITITKSKSDAGARTLTLEREHAAVLRRHRLATGRPPDGAPVFVDENGRRLSRHGRVRKGLARVAKAAGIEGVGFHVFRHSHATWLASAPDVQPHVLAARMGHTDPAFSMRRYVHASKGEIAAASDALGRVRARARAAVDPNWTQPDAGGQKPAD